MKLSKVGYRIPLAERAVGLGKPQKASMYRAFVSAKRAEIVFFRLHCFSLKALVA